MRLFLATVVLAIYAGVTDAKIPDTYFAKQVPISKTNLLANIGPSGSRASGAASGIVIASPSTVNPDYLFTWTRDSALVFKTIVDLYTAGRDTALRTHIDNYVAAQAKLQTVSNPSGTISTGGLGEPKFNIDGTAFTGSWGRPQRDGPALRSTALTTYANWLLDNGNTTWVTNTLWPILKLDLDYTATFWNYTGFDLWEEVSSSSFFTTAAQQRALQEGATLATRLGQTASATSYKAQAANALCLEQSYWNPSAGFITSNTGGGRSGKDANSALASIHNFDPAAGCDAVTFQPCSDKALSSLKVYVDSFRSIYPINAGIASNAAVATGRYPEDVYFNGNPWYLTTAAVAEQLYDAIIVWKAQRSITVTSISLAFFRQFSSSVAAGTYASTTPTYTTLLSGVQTFADNTVGIISKYTPTNGSLSEQYLKSSPGTPLSAAHLTWSYASILTASTAQSGAPRKGWGARGLVVPSVCASNQGPTVQVTFIETATTVLGAAENIYITGSIDQLKGWSPDNAILLSSANYPDWNITLAIPASTSFEYKFIRKNNGVVTWESDPNRAFTTPANGSVTATGSWR